MNMIKYIKDNIRKYLIEREYSKYFYTPNIKEFIPGFMFDYLQIQVIPGYEYWQQNCLYKTTPFNSDKDNADLKEMIANKKIRAIKKDVNVRVYCKPQIWQPEDERIIVLPFWLAKNMQNIYYNKPGDVQILGVDNDYLAREPIIPLPIPISKFRLSLGGSKIRNYNVQHYYQWLNRDNIGNVSVKTYRDMLESSNKGFIFEFPVDEIDSDPFETIKIEILPRTIFGIELRHKTHTNPFYINGIEGYDISKDDPIWKKLFALGNKKLNDTVRQDWQDLIFPELSNNPSSNMIGKYCTGIIIYNEIELITSCRKYVILTKHIYNY